jgi:hypothetical protein
MVCNVEIQIQIQDFHPAYEHQKNPSSHLWKLTVIRARGDPSSHGAEKVRCKT